MGLDMMDPEEDYDSESEIQDMLPDAEPMMVVDGDEVFVVDDEDANLMES